jgi:hypothetical protein
LFRVAIKSKKTEQLDLYTKVKVTEARKKKKLTPKQVVTKFANIRKTQVYNILKAKHEIKKPVAKL